MKTPSDLPRWTPLPTPILLGVIASWIPLSAPVMAGLAFGSAAYFGLRMLFPSEPAPQAA